MASVIVTRSGFAATALAMLGVGADSPRKSLGVLLLAALLLGALGLALDHRGNIADFFNRASKVLGQSAGAAGNLPLAKSLVALLDQRSPGERTKGELAKDKKRLAARPQQRALGKVRPGLPAPFVKALTTPVPDGVPVVELISPLKPEVLPGPLFASAPAVFAGGPVGVGGGGGPGGGGGGPGGGGGTPPAIEVPPVVAPVPEPATWLTMLLGFYILARALRKQRPVNAHGVALVA